jgi:hypothetical protein
MPRSVRQCPHLQARWCTRCWPLGVFRVARKASYRIFRAAEITSLSWPAVSRRAFHASTASSALAECAGQSTIAGPTPVRATMSRGSYPSRCANPVTYSGVIATFPAPSIATEESALYGPPPTLARTEPLFRRILRFLARRRSRAPGHSGYAAGLPKGATAVRQEEIAGPQHHRSRGRTAGPVPNKYAVRGFAASRSLPGVENASELERSVIGR